MVFMSFMSFLKFMPIMKDFSLNLRSKMTVIKFNSLNSNLGNDRKWMKEINRNEMEKSKKWMTGKTGNMAENSI